MKELSKKKAHKTILVVHASVGSGHKTAAEAIGKAFKDLFSSNPLETHIVKIVDILDYGRIKFDGNAVASSFTGATRPLYDLTWRYFFTGRLLWGGGTSWSRVMFGKFTQLVRDLKPDAIICTHITAANAAVGAKLITKQNFPIICVPTDYEAEGLWPHKYTDLFCVANEQMAETLRARKVEEKRILITGIPANPQFSISYDKQKSIEEFDLDNSKQNALILAGASLPRPYINLRQVINELIPYMHRFNNINFSIVAGKDIEYKNELTLKVSEYGLNNVRVFGFVEEIPKLMCASDFVICKAGGLTVTECLCEQVPMILTCRAYGQEKANVKMLTAAGAALHVTTKRELFDAIMVINNKSNTLEGIRQNSILLRKPKAAKNIAIKTLSLIDSVNDPSERSHKHFCTLYIGEKPAHPR